MGLSPVGKTSDVSMWFNDVSEIWRMLHFQTKTQASVEIFLAENDFFLD